MLEERKNLDLFRAGDKATLAAVYREHAPEIASLVARGFGFRAGVEVHRFFGFRAPHEQQDAVQEVFVRAFSERGRMSYDGITPYRSYLRAILKNLVVDDFRRRKSALSVFAQPNASGHDDGGDDDLLDAAERAESPAEPADVVVDRKRMTDAMRGFVDTLPERERRFVALRYTEGLAQEDVAKRMRVGRSTVRTLEDRVRRRLHEKLARAGLLEEPRRNGVAGFFARLVPSAVLAMSALLFATIGGAHGG